MWDSAGSQRATCRAQKGGRPLRELWAVQAGWGRPAGKPLPGGGGEEGEDGDPNGRGDESSIDQPEPERKIYLETPRK